MKKISLKSETVRQLSMPELRGAVGGGNFTVSPCQTAYSYCFCSGNCQDTSFSGEVTGDTCNCGVQV